MSHLKLILVHTSPAVCAALASAFAFDSTVSVINAKFEAVSIGDALITPGNSFGLMDGGFDLAVSRAFPGVEQSVQGEIEHHYGCWCPVGSAFSVHTGCAWRPFLIYAPTMPVPQNIERSCNVFLASVAAFAEARRLARMDGIRDFLCPGLGTATGRLPPAVAAAQMALAWRMSDAMPRRDWPTAMALFNEVAASTRW